MAGDRPRQKNGHAPRVTKAEYEKRIEEARKLMSLDYSDGELRRMLSAKWGCSRVTVGKYLTRARGRNRELVGKSPEDCRSDSLLYWRALKAESMQARAEGRKEFKAATEEIERAQATLDDPTSPDEQTETAMARLKLASRRQEKAGAKIGACERNAADYQDRIDKLLGNHAPLKVSETTPDGKAVSRRAEPSDPEKELRRLLESAGVVAEPA
ncbi:hypothetical protein [Alienimonas sp. DA493]|uniref:hypothetical protein n=1 Tax=Alienimonas sp. DA493 TaxID=3373605 RepID=UPI00375482C6